MSMYGYDVSFYDYGFSDPAITSPLYGNSLSLMAAAVDYEDEIYVRRRPPTRRSPPSKTPSSPPKHRHDGTSPLPLGMDWSLPPRIWEGRNSVWPHDSNKGWSYCVTVPCWTIVPSASGSDTVFFSIQVGIQSPEGITTTRGVLRRFNEFLKLHSELRKEFPKKSLPLAPARRLMMRSKTRLEERRCALEGWVEKLLSDIDVSRSALVAIFLELEAAARQSCCELTQNESAANSVPSCQFSSNSGISVLGDNSIEQSTEGLQGELEVATPSEERHKVTTMQERLGTTKMDMEDLIARLNQEIIARQYLTTKVKDLEMEVETSQSSKETLHQAISTESEGSTHMQLEMEELLRKCMELELRLTFEQDARAYFESMNTTIIQHNEMLLKELHDAKEQIEILRKQQDEVELKSKSDVKLLVKEVKSLRKSHSESKREFSKCLEEKGELEKEKKGWEVGNACKVALLLECELLRKRLQECSLNFLVEDKLIVDTSLSDAIDPLETSDAQIGLLLAEAQLLAQDAETVIGPANKEDVPIINRDDDLRTLLRDILTENAKLRKQVNAVIRHALSTAGNTPKEEAEDDDDDTTKTGPNKSLD